MPTEARETRRLVADERGAVMVMGLFMCSCLVGALWYLAGLGDAILYRERMQEAADAVAFSDAALHARGMNLVVLLNLVMATVLSLRVLLRVAKLVLVIAAALFGGLGFVDPALWAAVPATTAAARVVDVVDRDTKPVIDGALLGLNGAQEGIVRGTPSLSRAGASAVGMRYAAVTDVALLTPAAELPVENRRPDKLCAEASLVLPELVGWLFEQVHLAGAFKPASEVIGPLLEEMAAASPGYFCDLEPGAADPGTATRKDSEAVKQRCQNLDGAAAERRLRAAEKQWLDACVARHVSCVSRDAGDVALPRGLETGAALGTDEERATLELLRGERDFAANSYRELIRQRDDFFRHPEKCEAWAAQELEAHRRAFPASAQPSAPTQAARGVMPMLVRGFSNGAPAGQIQAGVASRRARFDASSRLVRLGAFRDKRTRALVEPQAARLPAWAQAELFFDCDAPWGAPGCDADDEAMWHFRWRARLRRVNAPAPALVARLAAELGVPAPKVGPDAFADALAAAAVAPLATGWKANAGLRKDLASALRDPANRTQGVH